MTIEKLSILDSLPDPASSEVPKVYLLLQVFGFAAVCEEQTKASTDPMGKEPAKRALARYCGLYSYLWGLGKDSAIFRWFEYWALEPEGSNGFAQAVDYVKGWGLIDPDDSPEYSPGEYLNLIMELSI